MEENFKFIEYVKGNYPQKILRLETEYENEKSVATYNRMGFKPLPYLEMIFTKAD